MRDEERDALLARAAKLEEDAIKVAETNPDTHNWPRESAARCAHAELKLKVAVLLRLKAETYYA